MSSLPLLVGFVLLNVWFSVCCISLFFSFLVAILLTASDDTVAIFKLVLLKRRYLIYINMYNYNFATITIPFLPLQMTKAKADERRLRGVGCQVKD